MHGAHFGIMANNGHARTPCGHISPRWGMLRPRALAWEYFGHWGILEWALSRDYGIGVFRNKAENIGAIGALHACSKAWMPNVARYFRLYTKIPKYLIPTTCAIGGHVPCGLK